MVYDIICDGDLVATCPSEDTAVRVAIGLADYDEMDIVGKNKGWSVKHFRVNDDQTGLVQVEDD